jgi:hypothetical protein
MLNERTKWLYQVYLAFRLTEDVVRVNSLLFSVIVSAAARDQRICKRRQGLAASHAAPFRIKD